MKRTRTARAAARSRPALSASDRSEGLSEVRSFLDAFRQLPVDMMAKEEAQSAVQALAQKSLRASSNPPPRRNWKCAIGGG